VNRSGFSYYRRRGKRLLDVAAAAGLLLLLWPVLAALALAIRLTMGKPVLFRQVRAGYLERPFTLLKFRSMRDARDACGQLLPDRVRLTPLGRWLRKTSLDELPQLWNVLRNEMSLVGPRPLLMEYLRRYTAFQARRHEVRPGITGWAQVRGRQTISFTRRIEADVWYVDSLSLRTDLAILLATMAQVFVARGVKLGQEASEVDDLAPQSLELHDKPEGV
jgi:sugar transferase EpsL